MSDPRGKGINLSGRSADGMTGKCSIPVGRPTQLSLLGETCLDCGTPSSVNVLESATFTGACCTEASTAVVMEMDCAACGSRVLQVRRQRSSWVERVWG